MSWSRAAATVHLATDDRAERFAGISRRADVHPIAVGRRCGSQNPFALAQHRFWRSGAACVRLARLIGRIKPAAVVGFGGYPTVPPLLAARLRGVPTIAARAERGDRPRQPAARRRVDAHRRPASGVPIRDRQLRAPRPRSPAIRCARRSLAAAADALYAADPNGPFRCWCSAAARARSSCPISCRRPSRGCEPQLRDAPARSCSRRARRMCGGCEAVYAALGVACRRSRPSSPTCRRAWRPRHLVIVALRRLDRGRIAAIGRPGDPGAAAACARPGPAANAAVLAERGRRCVHAAERLHARAAGHALIGDCDGGRREVA